MRVVHHDTVYKSMEVACCAAKACARVIILLLLFLKREGYRGVEYSKSMQEKWESVLQSLQPLLRACEDGDTSLRWIMMDALPGLVRECGEVARADVPQPFVMRLYELLFVVRLLKAEVVQSLGVYSNLMQKCSSQSMEVLQQLDAAASGVAKCLASLLDIPKTDSKRPILCLMKESYGLSLQQCALVALLAVTDQTRVPILAKYVSDRAQTIQVDKVTALNLIGMNSYEFESFSDDETSIVKDGMLIVTTANSMRYSSANLTLKPEFCYLVNGSPLTPNQKDKLKHAIFWSQIRPYLQVKLSSESAQDIAQQQQQRQQPQREHHQPSTSSPTPPIKALGSDCPQHVHLQRPAVQVDASTFSASSEQPPGFKSDDVLSPSSPSCADAGLPPYRDDADFMEDKFEHVSLIMRLANQRIEDDLNKSSNKGPKSYFDHFQSGGGSSASVTKTLENELHALNIRIQMRLKLMKDQGMKMPQLERVKEQLGLSDFEERVLLYLAGKAIASVKFAQVRSQLVGPSLTRQAAAGSVYVGELLDSFSANFREGIENRKCFGKSGRLVKNGFLVVNSSAQSAYSKELRNCEVCMPDTHNFLLFFLFSL